MKSINTIIFIFVVTFLNNAVFSFQSDNEPHLCSLSKIKYFTGHGLTDFDYPGDSTIDVTYYKLDLKITTTPDLLNGTVTVNATSLSILSSFFLDFEDNMSIDSIKKGEDKLSYSQANDKLFITLPESVPVGKNISIVITYHGIPDVTGLGSFEFSENQGVPAIWTLSEPYGAKTWFPNKDNPSDKADSSDVWITIADNLTGVSNGILEEEVNNGNGTKTFKWKSRYPIAPYLISLAIADYSIKTNYFKYSPTDSMLVIDYIYPQNLLQLESLLDETPQMLDVMSDYFGEYPFITEKYGHAEFGVFAGMEHQTISSMGAFYVNIMVHELTHQWFGDKITCADWENIWLNEGFAVYGEALYQERINGRVAYDDFIQSNMGRAKNAVGSIYVQDISSIDQIFDADRTYAKGGVVVHMLRGVMGDTDFFAFLKAYMSDSSLAYGSATTTDLQVVAERVSGKSLGYFFNEWIYGENYPRYIVDWDFNQIQGSQYNLAITISQQVNTFPAYFTMPITMKIGTSSGDTTLTVFNSTSPQTFDFVVNGKPISMNFDPDNYILKEVSGNAFNIPVFYSLEQNYPNPFNPITTINYELGNVSDVKLTVYDVTGKEITKLVNGRQIEGRYSVEFNSVGLSSGVYFYKLEAVNSVPGSGEDFTSVKKMVIIK